MPAVKYYHRGERGFELQTTHSLLVDFLEGVSRRYAESGNQQRLRGPAQRSVLLIGKPMCTRCGGAGGEKFWLALGASFVFPTQAVQTVADTSSRVNVLLYVVSAVPNSVLSGVSSVRLVYWLAFVFAHRNMSSCQRRPRSQGRGEDRQKFKDEAGGAVDIYLIIGSMTSYIV